MLGFGRKNTNSTLTENQRLLLRRGERLVELTRQKIRESGTGNLTSSWQLRDDCQLVEQMTKKLAKSPSPEAEEKLAIAITRLQTTSENILNWRFTE